MDGVACVLGLDGLQPFGGDVESGLDGLDPGGELREALVEVFVAPGVLAQGVGVDESELVGDGLVVAVVSEGGEVDGFAPLCLGEVVLPGPFGREPGDGGAQIEVGVEDGQELVEDRVGSDGGVAVEVLVSGSCPGAQARSRGAGPSSRSGQGRSLPAGSRGA